MKKIIIIILFLITIHLKGLSQSVDIKNTFQKTFDKEMRPKINEVINKAVELNLFSGCVLIAKGNEILFTGAYGEANKDFHIKNTLETKFNIASGSKPITSMAIMLLVQKGLLSLNDSITKYLPDFPFGNKMKILHLLTHTSGLGHFSDTPEYIEKMHLIRGFNNVLESFIYKEKPLFEPGTNFCYSNSGVRVLGAIIEKVSGMKYADFVEQNIFSPLEMRNTCSKLPEEIIENRASGYEQAYSGKYYETSRLIRPTGPETGLRTTVEDLFKFIQAVIGKKLLNEDLTKKMLTPIAKNVPYAFLWNVKPDGIFIHCKDTTIGHQGLQPGFSSIYNYYTQSQYTIIILSNFGSGADEVLYQPIESILFGKEYNLPSVKIEYYLYSLIRKNGFENVQKDIINIIKNNNFKISDFNTLNDAGYSLLEESDYEMAINFFLLNVTLFPDNFDVYDSLGEAYLMSGNKSLAKKNYEKSIKLNPKNINAMEQLKKLK